MAGSLESPDAFFEHQLKTMLWVERKLADEVLLELRMQLQDEVLRRGVEEHLAETEGHVRTLERVFELLKLRPQAEPSAALEGIRRAHDEGLKTVRRPGVLADLFHADALATTEHLEISLYDGMIELAEAMAEPLVANALRGNLEQEERALRTVALGRRTLLEGAKAELRAG